MRKTTRENPKPVGAAATEWASGQPENADSGPHQQQHQFPVKVELIQVDPGLAGGRIVRRLRLFRVSRPHASGPGRFHFALAP